MKIYLGSLAFLFSLGCSSVAAHDFRFIEIPSVINEVAEKKLAPAEVAADLEQLDYALQHAYSGRRFLPGAEFQQLNRDLSQIRGSSTAIDLCRNLALAFTKVSDNHLRAKFNDQNCSTAKPFAGSVGPNENKGGVVPWKAYLKKRDGYLALTVDVTSFPSSTDPIWDGFLAQVRKLLDRAQLVIIDYRGNGGGDDTIGQELADILAGQRLKTPYGPQWTSRTPESAQVFVNYFEYRRRQDQTLGRPVAHLKKLAEEYAAIRDDAVSGRIPLEKWSIGQEGRQPFEKAKGTEKPIYLLMDKVCASSCESSIDFFEFNPDAKKVGESTAGFIHFGNNGRVFLRNSGIAVQMATSYNTYFDGRFLEKTGLKPDIAVAAGGDAVEAAWSDFLVKIKTTR